MQLAPPFFRRLAIALALVLVAGPSSGAARRDAARHAGEGEPTLHALLVGCSEYPFLRQALGDERYAREIRLAGPVNDVELVRAALERVLGLERAHTRVLAGWPEDEAARPTRANVLDALAELAERAGPGDRAVVFLAGHGSQQRVQRQKSDEPDGLDEVFLAADARPAKSGWIPNSIRDDELGASVRAIRDAGADVWLIVDACHSGTMLRGEQDAGVRLRGIDPALLGVTSALRGGGGSRARGRRRSSGESWLAQDDSARIAALYGAQSYGRAPEMPIPGGAGAGEVHGLFSWILCQELERTGGRATYRELSERVVAAYQAFPCAITVPGAEGDLSREVASGAAVEGQRLLCTLRGGTPWLNQGRLAGLEAGSVAALLDAEGQELARVAVVAAEAFESRCRWLGEGRDSRLAGAEAFPARIEQRAGSDWRLGIALLDAEGGALAPERAPEALRRALADEAERFPLVARDAADWWLVVDEQEGFRLRPGAREGGFDLFDVDAAGLAASLRRIQTTRNLRRCSGDLLGSAWSGELDVWVERKPPRGRARRLRPGETVHPLDAIRVLLSKSSGRIFDVHVFYLDARFGRSRLFPRSGATPRLEAAATGTIPLTSWLTVVDDGLGLEQILVLATPREPASPVLDLSWLGQEGRLRGAADAPSGPLEDLLAGMDRGGDLRGQAFGAAPEVSGTQSLLVSLRTDWRALAPPAWPRGSPQVFEPLAAPDADAGAGPLFPHGLPPGVPDPWDAGTRAALGRSPAAERAADLLLLGDETVRAVWIDLDGDALAQPAAGSSAAPAAAALARERAFDAEAAFLFAADGRYAFYDARASGALELVLVDRDGDGVAEERHRLEGERWRSWRGVALAWSSQVHLPRGLGGSSEERAARLAVLQGEE